jgi:hypothetical protein
MNPLAGTVRKIDSDVVTVVIRYKITLPSSCPPPPTITEGKVAVTIIQPFKGNEAVRIIRRGNMRPAWSRPKHHCSFLWIDKSSSIQDNILSLS